MSKSKAVLATVDRNPFTCHVCGNALFFDREVKMNSQGMEFFDLGWANQSAVGLLCGGCGYVRLFLSRVLEMWKPERGYPEPRRRAG